MIGAIVIALVAILVFCSVAFVWACIVIAKDID